MSAGPLRAIRSRLRQLMPGADRGEGADAAAAASSRPIGASNGGSEEDARILRRTRFRLMAVSGFVTLVILVILGTALYTTVATVFRVNSENALRARAESFIDRDPRQGSQDPEYQLQFGRNIATQIVTPSGQVLAGLLSPGLPYRPGVAAAVAGHDGFSEASLPGGTPVRVYSMGVVSNLYGPLVIQTIADRSQEVNLLHTLELILLGGGLAALLAALLAGYLYAGRALVPIRASLARQRDALKRQRDFTANASHELRTPLTIIRASVEDLRRNRRSRVEEVGEALGDIDAEVSHLTALVEDLLLLARTDSGVVQVDRLPLDLADVAAEAASALAPLGEERGVRVVLDPLPAPIVGDPLRLRQLVTILVDNAIRHGGRGSDVTVHVKTDEATGGALLGVEDAGPGIKPEDLPMVFERFWRGDSAPAGGTGLGLAIAKWIVEQHAGTIVASNRPEGGARFLVRLPAGEAPEEPGESQEVEPLADLGAAHRASPLADETAVWSPPDGEIEDEEDVPVSADRG